MPYTKISDVSKRDTLEEHLAKFPFSVFIPCRHDYFSSDRVRSRHLWLSALHGDIKEIKSGMHGWMFGENAESLYRNGGPDADPAAPYQYIFKDANTAMEFKLRFG